MVRIVVDLPAPLGPRNPVTLPGRTRNVRSSTATVAPYRLRTPVTVISMVVSPFVGTHRASAADSPGTSAAIAVFAIPRRAGASPSWRRIDSARRGRDAGTAGPTVE